MFVDTSLARLAQRFSREFEHDENRSIVKQQITQYVCQLVIGDAMPRWRREGKNVSRSRRENE
jgi:hypothetical protein